MAQEEVLEHEVLARTYPGQDGRDQQPEQFKHAPGSQIYPRAGLPPHNRSECPAPVAAPQRRGTGVSHAGSVGETFACAHRTWTYQHPVVDDAVSYVLTWSLGSPRHIRDSDAEVSEGHPRKRGWVPPTAVWGLPRRGRLIGEIDCLLALRCRALARNP